MSHEDSTATPEEVARLRHARQAARALWKRSYQMGRIEQELRNQGFDEATAHTTMHHLFGDFMGALERQERILRYWGVTFVAVGALIGVVTFIAVPVTGRGFILAGVTTIVGLLTLVRSAVFRARLSATRRHRWMSERPEAGGM